MKTDQILIGILIGAVATVAFYTLDDSGREDNQLSLKKECAAAGERARKRLIDELGYDWNKYTVLESTYAYNKELDTCLYKGGLFNSDSIQRWVRDSYSNEELLLLWMVGDNHLGNVSSVEEFEVRADALMNSY